MGSGVRAAGSGILIGLVTVLLLQQLGYLGLTDLVASVTDLAVAAVVGAIIFGLVGWRAGVRYRRRHPTGSMAEWKPGAG